MLVISGHPGFISITLPYDTKRMVGYPALSLMENEQGYAPNSAFNHHRFQSPYSSTKG